MNANMCESIDLFMCVRLFSDSETQCAFLYVVQARYFDISFCLVPFFLPIDGRLCRLLNQKHATYTRTHTARSMAHIALNLVYRNDKVR